MTLLSRFVAELACPCGAPAPVDMLTRIEPQPPRDVIRVGDDTGVGWGAVARAYLPIREPAPGEPVRLLQAWTCDACGTLNWAEIVLDDGRVTEITAVPLDAAALGRVHAIDDEVVDIYLRATGEELFVDGRHRPGFAERLRAALS